MAENSNGNKVAQKAQLKKQDYEKELRKLQTKLVEMQEWVRVTGAKVVVLFEGRDAAGKGGVIHRIMERVSPRIFRHVALPAPTEREKSQLYAQRYMKELPAAGEVILLDRSWYNRALVEHVMGYCSDKQYDEFLRMSPGFESLLRNNGIFLVKYWFEVSEQEQHKRFLRRIQDPMRRWKLSPMDLESHRRWYDYSRARDAMFAATDTNQSPWYVVQTDDKQKPKGYKDPNWNYHWIPERY